MFVRELQEGSEFEGVLVVREAELRARRDGGPFLRLMLADRTGRGGANGWGEVEPTAAAATVGALVRVCGRLRVSDHHGAELALYAMCPAEAGSYDEAALLDGPPRT